MSDKIFFNVIEKNKNSELDNIKITIRNIINKIIKNEFSNYNK